MDFFRDPVWEGIISVIGIITVGLGLVFRARPLWKEKILTSLRTLNIKTALKVAFIIGVFGIGFWIGRMTLGSVNSSEAVELESQVAEVAWHALEKEEFALAFSLADTCISNFEEEALQMQSLLSKEPAPATGKVNDDEETSIRSHRVLNEVASCYFIQGEVYETSRCIKEAQEAYSKIDQFPYARISDPKQGIFWSPLEEAKRRIASMSLPGDSDGNATVCNIH